KVYVDAFLIDRCEVTNAEYRRFVAETGHPPPPGWSGNEFPEDEGNHPVTGVSWYDARQYAEWAGKRLPTEEEWEKAARGTDGRLYPWGNEFEAGKANTLESGSRGPVATGAHEQGASPYGCLDMAGNALEWTLTESQGDDGESYRVLKGGCWYFPGTNTRSEKRFKDYPTSRLRSNGFRCCRDAD
ncbi:MAG: SUMF1/EgtB/PvdO family nonheme iron enzyme, partial [Planctomycetes bacterium]|nr:SUMF1/EgtB/PvdO family nonheme iron enzyme [Planctomycetota bacterium]